MTPIVTVRGAQGCGAIPETGLRSENKRVQENLEASYDPLSPCSHLQAILPGYRVLMV